MSSSLQSFDSNLNKTVLIKQHKTPLKILNTPVNSSVSLHYMSISSCDISTASAINGKLQYNELSPRYLKTDYVQGISTGHDPRLSTQKQIMAASRPKKRKKLNLQSSDQEWDIATNKVCEKVGPRETIHSSKRRLVLSTNLMQHLLQPAPAFILSGNARFNYEIVMYFVSRITLADACCIKNKITDQDQEYPPLIKTFKEKLQKLEIDLQRLEKTTSMVDIITEIHELERFSMLNHLAKFHSRTQVTNSTSRTTMPKNLPESVHCLPL